MKPDGSYLLSLLVDLLADQEGLEIKYKIVDTPADKEKEREA